MSSNDPTDFKKDELELEKVKLEQMKLELEFEKAKQDALQQRTKEPAEHTTKENIILVVTAICVIFLAPIGIILLWTNKTLNIERKVFFTFAAILAFSVQMGWINVPNYFVFLSQ